ncbi:MAG: hypothetical protein V1743_03620 [Nanoarchaeota archaeon]
MKKVVLISFFIILLFLLFLLSSCSWQEFSDSVDSVEKELVKLFSISSSKNTTNEPEVPKVEECVSQECMESAFRQCLWAKGNYTDSMARQLELSIDSMESVRERFGQDADFCYVTMKIVRSWNASEQGAVYYCKVPKEHGNDSIEDIFTTTSPYCGGTMFDEMQPEVKFFTYSDAGLRISQFNVTSSEIVFDFTPTDKTIYLKSMQVSGAFFENCTLEFKNPLKILKGERQVMSIGCSGMHYESSRVFGNFAVSYYEKPSFIELKNAEGSFVGVTS